MRSMRGLVLAIVATCCSLLGGLAFASAPALATYENLCKTTDKASAFCTAGKLAEPEPVGIAVDNSSGAAKGDVYVPLLGKVAQFKENGEPGSTLTPPAGTELRTPNYVAVENATGDVYVEDYSEAGHLVKFKPNGELETAFGTGGEVAAKSIAGIGVDQKTGEVFIAERGTNEVKVYSSKGEPKESFAASVSETLYIGLAVNSNGDVYIDYLTCCSTVTAFEVVEYPAGKRGAPEVIDNKGAAAVAVEASTGKVYVAEQATNSIAVYAEGATTSSETLFAGELSYNGELTSGPWGIGINETNHTIYVTNRKEGFGEIFALAEPR